MTRRKTTATPAGVPRSRAGLTRRERAHRWRALVKQRRLWCVIGYELNRMALNNEQTDDARFWAEWDSLHQFNEPKEQR
jgi:hypothetical protein